MHIRGKIGTRENIVNKIELSRELAALRYWQARELAARFTGQCIRWEPNLPGTKDPGDLALALVMHASAQEIMLESRSLHCQAWFNREVPAPPLGDLYGAGMPDWPARAEVAWECAQDSLGQVFSSEYVVECWRERWDTAW